MTKKHSTKKALMASVLSLLLCFSMLIGTTFAWFTDSVTSANNIIKSGNLDIELEYWNGTDWVDVAGKSDILTNTLWEPGVAEVAYLRVANAGSLALKYQLGVNIVSEKAGVNVAGEEFKLSDYIQFGVVESTTFAEYANRDAAVAAVTNAKKISAGYTKADSLAADAAPVYLALIVYMPTDVGNVANHDGTNVPEINLGINVIATQMTAEFDSFGNDYDEDAWHPDMEVTTAADLQAALNNGVTNIALADDIDLEEPIVIPAPAASTYSLRRNANAVVINLNGKKITSNLTSGRAILVQGAAEIKNGTITTTNGVGAIFATGKSASLILTDMTVAVTGTGTNKEWILTAVGAANGAKVVINNGTYSAEKGYGLVVSTTGADVTINDGIFTTEGTTESAAVRFDSGWDNSKVYTKAVINGGVFNAPEGGFAFTANNAYGKDITINGGTFNGKVASHYQDNGVVINGGIFNDKLFEGGNHTDKYQIKGGTFSFDPTKRVAEGFKVVEANGTYHVVADGFKVIASAADLVALGGQKLEGTYVLVADINMNGAAMPTIGAAYGKTLTIVGNGHTISNATTAHTAHNGMKHHGFFYAYTNSTLTISDLTFDNIVVDATKDAERNYGAAVVVAYADGGSTINLTNVDVKNSKVLNSTPDIGDEAGIYVGYQTGTLNMVDCDSINCVVAGETDAKTGAFIGMVNGTANVTNCTTDMTIGLCNRIGGTLTVDGAVYVIDAAGLEKAVKAGAKAVILAEGDYALRFTNHTNFNLNDMTIKGLGDVNLAISSTEAWYGRVQGSNVTFENIHFTSSVGATGKATYNNCTFDSWAICASSNKEETTFNNCTINGCLNTSTDFSSGDVFVNNCEIAKAEYSGSMTMNFVDCQIGEIIIWNANTNLTNCEVTKLDDSNVTNATVTIK